MDERPGSLKSVLEPSGRKDAPPQAGLRPAPGCQLKATGCARSGHAASRTRIGAPPAPSGAKPTTYSTMGRCHEHGNLDPSAGLNRVGKPPGPATSRTGGGASVVVSAQESCVQGEGRQSIWAAAKAPGKAVYSASESDMNWLRNVQRKLYQRSHAVFARRSS